jgi:hypothetical protein
MSQHDACMQVWKKRRHPLQGLLGDAGLQHRLGKRLACFMRYVCQPVLALLLHIPSQLPSCRGSSLATCLGPSQEWCKGWLKVVHPLRPTRAHRKHVHLAGKNPSAQASIVLVQGSARGTTGSTITANWQLQLNNPSYEPSDWAVSSVVTWDSALTDDEMESVSSAFLLSLSSSSLVVSELGSTCGCSTPMPACGGSTNALLLPCLTCLKCTAGRYTVPACSAGCLPCPYGTFSVSSSVTACSSCPAGSYSMTTGATACLACLGAKFAQFVGQTSCTDVSVIDTSEAWRHLHACMLQSILPLIQTGKTV